MLKQKPTRRKFLKRGLQVGASIMALQGLSPLNGFAKPRLKLPERIVFLGDSITMAGNYINIFEYYIRMRYPEWNGEIINMGLSSETVSGLSEPKHPFPRPNIHSRVRNVLRVTKPQLVFICYGMNCGIYHPFSEERFGAYKSGLLGLVNLVKDSGADMVLLTPPPFAHKGTPVTQLAAGEAYGYTQPFEGYDQVLKGYGTWLQAEFKGEYPVVDIHTALSPYKDLCYGKDVVHPNQYGHFIMAHTILESLELLKTTKWRESAKTISDSNAVTIQKPYAVISTETILWNKENPLKEQIASFNALYLKLKGIKRDQQFSVKLSENVTVSQSGSVWRKGIALGNELVEASGVLANEAASALWDLICKKREVYDRALLNEIGHGKPDVKAVTFEEALKFKNEFEERLIALKVGGMLTAEILKV